MSNFPDRIKLSTCSEEMALRSKDTVRDCAKPQDHAGMAEVLQSFMSKIESLEDTFKQKKVKVQELMETRERQEENTKQLLHEREQFRQRISLERKNQEILGTTIAKTMHTCATVHSHFKAMEPAISFLQTEGLSCFEFAEDMKQKSEHLASFMHEMSNVQVPSFIAYLENAVKQKRDENAKLSAAIQERKEKQRNEKEVLLHSIAKKKALLSNLESELASEKEAAKNQSAQIESLTHERLEHKKALTKQLEQLNQENDDMKADIRRVEADIAAASSEMKNLQSDLAEAQAKEEKLRVDSLKTKERLDCLAKSLVVKKEQQGKVDSELSAQSHLNENLRKDLEEIKKKLKETKVDTDNQVSEFKREILRGSTAFAEREEHLLKSVKETREKERNFRREAEMAKIELLQIQKELADKKKSLSKTLESNSFLKNKLNSCDQEIENLKSETKRQKELLSVERETASSKESLLLQLKAKHDDIAHELHQQIASAEEEENAILDELNVSKAEEQDVLLKIEELEKNDSLSHTMIIEKHKKDILALDNLIFALEVEIKDLSGDHTCEIQQNIVDVNNALSQKDNELANLEVSIASRKEELIGLAKDIKESSIEKQEKLLKFNALSETVKCTAEALAEKKGRVQELQSLIEADSSKIEDTDLQISELSLKLQNAQEEFSKIMAENESAKQAFVRDHVKFQKTCEYREDETKVLQKQISTWNDKLEETQRELTVLRNEASAAEQSARAAEGDLKELDSEIESLRAEVLLSEKEALDKEKQAAHTKKKVDELSNKIKACREAKKKAKSEGCKEVFKMPIQGASKKSTPQCSASLSSVESSPHTILQSVPHSSSQQEKWSPYSALKSSNKLPTLEGKKVSLAPDDDLDDSQSSASTIVLVPELVDKIAEDPGVLRILADQQWERRAAKRRLKSATTAGTPQDEEFTPCKKSISDNEISSSTPENNPPA